MSGHGEHGDGVSLVSLSGPRTGAPDLEVTLEARQGRFALASGEEIDGYTLNGTSSGPELRARDGDLIRVTLRNVDVQDGTTPHWHGVDPPNAEDPGTYWYHSHQVSHQQVRRGLFGVLVVEPAGAPARASDPVAAVHSYSGRPTSRTPE